MPTDDQTGQIVKTAARGEIVGDWWVMAAFVGSDQHDHMTAEPFKTKTDALQYLNLLRSTTKGEMIVESLPEEYTARSITPLKARRYWIELEPDVQDEAAMIRETLGLPYHATVAQVLAKIAELRKRGD